MTEYELDLSKSNDRFISELENRIDQNDGAHMRRGVHVIGDEFVVYKFIGDLPFPFFRNIEINLTHNAGNFWNIFLIIVLNQDFWKFDDSVNNAFLNIQNELNKKFGEEKIGCEESSAANERIFYFTKEFESPTSILMDMMLSLSCALDGINAQMNKDTLRMKNSKTNQPSQGCYVATAVYGSYDCPQVWTLRRYRDYTLAETWYGRAFIKIYYAISPTLVKWFGHTEWFKKMWQGKLDRLVSKLQQRGFASTPYEDQKWI